MAEESWNEARLIPTSGIGGAEEQEKRATSALLAVMGSVKEFGRAITSPLGASTGQLRTYVEVPFLLGDRKVFPDGLISVSRGGRSWIALVEVKTGKNTLETEQIENYLQVARERGYQAVLTISNELPAAAGQHPTKVSGRYLRSVELHHLSWAKVLSEAVMQKEHRGVADPDQAWILGELIRYLEHPKSGALEFEDMSYAWVSVRESIAGGTLRPTDKGLEEVATRFDALLRYASLRLGRRLGTEVAPDLTRRERADPQIRSRELMDSMVNNGTMVGSIRIPNTVGCLNIEVDIRAGRVRCHVDIDAPDEGRARTRVNWVVRQLKSAPDDTRVEAFALRSRGSGLNESLQVVRATPDVLIADPAKELRSFRVSRSAKLGTKRDSGSGSFIASVLAAVDEFYGDVMQYLKAWSASPPRLREQVQSEEPVSKSLVSTALSSQDGAESVSAAEPLPNGAALSTYPTERQTESQAAYRPIT